MDKQEFLLLIPAIIYGVAIVDLLKIFDHRKNYIEIVGWGLFTMMAVIFSWIELYNKLELVTANNTNFFLIVIQSVLYAKAAGIITPEEKDVDTKQYFFEVRKLFFLLLSASTLFNLLLQYFLYHNHPMLWLRIVTIIFFLSCAYVNKSWIRILILSATIVFAILRVFSEVLVS